MCHYITAVLPADANAAALETVFRAHGRALSICSNATSIRPLVPGERCFSTTRNHCDCGTPLGGAQRAARRETDPEILAARMRRKGWGSAKIARALAQRDVANSRERTQDHSQTSLAEWCSLIQDVLGSGATPVLGLFLHFHGNEDAIEIEAREALRGGQVNESVLSAIKEDVLYEFRR